MARPTADDLVVETVGHCFICLEKVPPQFAKTDSGKVLSSNHSLQHLSRHLKLKMRKVFSQEDLIPEYLLVKVEKSILKLLKVSLCEGCARWNSKLSELYWQLEKIEVEAASYLRLLFNKMAASKTSLYNKLVDHTSTSGSALMAKLEIAEALRKKTIQKSSQALDTVLPKVRIQKLTINDIISTKYLQKSQRRFSNPSSIDNFPSKLKDDDMSIITPKLQGFKSERTDFDATPNDDDDGDLDDLVEKSETSELDYSPITTKDNSGASSLVKATAASARGSKYLTDSKTGKLKCTLCPKKFVSRGSFYQHYKSNHFNVRFKCSLCNSFFTQKANFDRHNRNIHLKQKFRCDICSKTFTDKSNLKTHQGKAHS